jgi:hypothetical protein
MSNPTAIEKELYPFSTEDNNAIPLEVIRPVSSIKAAIVASGTSSVTIPVGWKVAMIYASVGCFIEFNATTLPNPLVTNTPYADTLFIPAGSIITSTVLEGDATIVTAEGYAGFIVVQQIQKWAGIALPRQLGIK